LRAALRELSVIPAILRESTRAIDAARERRWVEVERSIRAIHDVSAGTDETRFLLGCALACQGRWDESVGSFREIKRGLHRSLEPTRWINEAVALHNLGRTEEAARLLLSKLESSWPEGILGKARLILAHLAPN
jgi:hypothetical protein